MRALILAAGQGKRLGKASKNRPKCLVELFGKTIINNQLEVLNSNNIEEINIVTGYKSNLLDNLNLNVYHNKDFEKTNMVFSMFQASDLFDSDETDLIVAYGDIIYEKGNLEKLMNSKSSISIMVDLNWKKLWSERFDNPLDDAETMKFDDDLNIFELGKKTDSYSDIQGQYTGLIKFDKNYLRKIKDTYIGIQNSNSIDYKSMYMTDFIQLLINKNFKVTASLVEGGWLEIDTEKDIDCYQDLYHSGKLKEFYKN
tara:strand:+ start:2395 stop:3162 length:768 start_codon:yes stop_codon:yes gene_type:complete